MLCLSVVLALQGLENPQDEIAEKLANERIDQTLQREEEGYAALKDKTANIKKIQDTTRAQLEQLRKSDFGSSGMLQQLQKLDPALPASFAELAPSKDAEKAVEHLHAVDADVDAQLEALDQKLSAREAQHKDRPSSLLEMRPGHLLDQPMAFEGVNLPHTKNFHESKALQAEDADLMKTMALRRQLHERAQAARDKFKDDMLRAEGSMQEEAKTKPPPRHAQSFSEGDEDAQDDDSAGDLESLVELRAQPAEPATPQKAEPAKPQQKLGPLKEADEPEALKDLKERVAKEKRHFAEARRKSHQRLLHDEEVLEKKKAAMEARHKKMKEDEAKLDADLAKPLPKPKAFVHPKQ